MKKENDIIFLFQAVSVEPTRPILLSGVLGHHAVSQDVASVSPFTK